MFNFKKLNILNSKHFTTGSIIVTDAEVRTDYVESNALKSTINLSFSFVSYISKHFEAGFPLRGAVTGRTDRV